MAEVLTSIRPLLGHSCLFKGRGNWTVWSVSGSYYLNTILDLSHRGWGLDLRRREQGYLVLCMIVWLYKYRITCSVTTLVHYDRNVTG